MEQKLIEALEIEVHKLQPGDFLVARLPVGFDRDYALLATRIVEKALRDSGIRWMVVPPDLTFEAWRQEQETKIMPALGGNESAQDAQ